MEEEKNNLNTQADNSNKPPKKGNLGLIIGIICIILGLCVIVGALVINNNSNNNDDEETENSNNSNTQSVSVLKISPYTDGTPSYEISYPKSWKLYTGDEFEENFEDVGFGSEVPKYVLFKDNVRIEFRNYSGAIEEEITASNYKNSFYGDIENIKINDLGNNIALYKTLTSNQYNGYNLIMSVGYKSLYDYIDETIGIDDDGYLINNKKANFCVNGQGINYPKKESSFGRTSMKINIMLQDYYSRYNGSDMYQVIRDESFDEVEKPYCEVRQVKI